MLSGDARLVTQVHLDAYFERHKSALRCFSLDEPRGAELMYYLHWGRSLHLMDQRDRLYAFLDMPMDQGNQVKIVPDYNKMALQIFYDLAAEYINTNRYPAILQFLLHTSESLQSDVPTWMPDWHFMTVNYALEGRHTRLHSHTRCVSSPVLVNDRILKLDGVLLGSISDLTVMFYANGPTADTLASMWATIQSWTLKGFPRSMRTLLSVLTAGYGVYPDQRSSIEREAEFVKAMEDVCRPGLCDTRNELDNRAKDVHELIRVNANGKKAILTELGSIELCPSVAQKGDLCAIVFGCTTPCVLRRTSKEHHFKFVGSCFSLGSQPSQTGSGETIYRDVLGSERSKDWVDWGFEEQDIFLC